MNFREFFSTEDYVRTIGIITANNPQGRKLTRSQNYDLNRSLLEDLKAHSSGTSSLRGSYGGNIENAFAVVNISRGKLIEFAEKYNQKSVVFGFVRYKDQYPYIQFQYIENGKIKEQKSGDFFIPIMRTTKDFLEAIKEGEFEFPFFEVEPEKNQEQPTPDGDFLNS